jgi:hypothetical protein
MTSQTLWKGKQKRLQGGIRISLKPLYGHLPETLSHDFLQKVIGLGDGFTGNGGITTS